MKAVVLCAGYGERIKPLTNVLPKPLFPILGRPILGHIIYYLRQFGINEIGVNTHWKAEKIIEYLGDGSVYISYEPFILGIGGGIGTMREFLTDDIFIVHNGDILSNIDIRPAIDFHINEGAICTIILHDYPVFNNVSVRLLREWTSFVEIVDINDKIQGFKDSKVQKTKDKTQDTKRRTQNAKLAYTGIAIMSKEMINFLPYKEPCSIIDVWVELIKSHSLKGYILSQPLGSAPTKYYWSDIGSVDGYLDVHRAILIDHIPLVSEIPSDNVYIGENSTISKLTKIDGFASIGNNCIIEANVSLENCVVWDNTIVRNGTRAKNCIVYPNGIYK